MKMQELSQSLERKLKLLEIENDNPRTPKFLAYMSKERRATVSSGEKRDVKLTFASRSRTKLLCLIATRLRPYRHLNSNPASRLLERRPCTLYLSGGSHQKTHGQIALCCTLHMFQFPWPLRTRILVPPPPPPPPHTIPPPNK